MGNGRAVGNARKLRLKHIHTKFKNLLERFSKGMESSTIPDVLLSGII